MAETPWMPWRKVMKFRDDLRSVALPLSIFAVDFYGAMMHRGKRPIYEKRQEFFTLCLKP